MEKIKIGTNDAKFKIESIRPISTNIIEIVFDGTVPAAFGDITLYNIGGIECCTFRGYSTIYRDQGRTVYLSNDGSVYTEPVVSSEVPAEPYIPTLEEVKRLKKQEVSKACQQTIFNGIDVTLSDGSIGHFSLTEHDQLNLFGKQVQISAGTTEVEYHADGQPCKYFSATDMQIIIETAIYYVSYQTTYCNALNMWISGCQTSEDVSLITYGLDVPVEYQSDVLKTYLAQISSNMDRKGGGW